MTLFNDTKNLATNSTTSNFPVPIQRRHCILHCLRVATLSSSLSIPSVNALPMLRSIPYSNTSFSACQVPLLST